MKKKAVIIFVRYPESGRVKTRLASKTSDSFALKFYNLTARYIFAEVEKLDLGVDKYLFYSPVTDIRLLKNWVNHDFFYDEQKGVNLGEKISNAFKENFERGYEKVIIIGSDMPDISMNIIKIAFSLLDENNVVIAPSDDGGYSLLGIDSFYPMLFENIEWSSENVFKATRRIIAENKLSSKILANLNDIDTREDLENWLSISADSDLAKKIKTIAKEENITL